MNKYSLLIGLKTNDGHFLSAEQIIHYISGSLNSFSVIEQTGYWQGQMEKSLIVYVIGLESEYAILMEKLGKKLQVIAKQDSVYLTVEPVTVTDINAGFVPRETFNSRVTK